MNLTDCLYFGIAQAFAIIPGASRSGVTITGGLIRNFKRGESAKFSFLLAAPLIAGAVVLEFQHFSAETFTSLPFIIGVVSSTVTSYLVIKFLLVFLKKQNFRVFVLYRLLLAIFILLTTLLNKNTIT